MRPALLLTAAMTLVACRGPAGTQTEQLTQQQNDQVKNEVKVALDSIIAKWAERDADGALHYYASDVAIEGDSAPNNYQGYLQEWTDFNKNLTAIRVTRFREAYTVLDRDLALSYWVGKSDNIAKSGDTLSFGVQSYTDVWKKVGGEWKVIYQHASSSIPVTHKAVVAKRGS